VQPQLRAAFAPPLLALVAAAVYVGVLHLPAAVVAAPAPAVAVPALAAPFALVCAPLLFSPLFPSSLDHWQSPFAAAVVAVPAV
jgi:hypothetical protein